MSRQNLVYCQALARKDERLRAPCDQGLHVPVKRGLGTAPAALNTVQHLCQVLSECQYLMIWVEMGHFSPFCSLAESTAGWVLFQKEKYN